VVAPLSLLVPEGSESLGPVAVERARSAGLDLDEHQCLVLDGGLKVREDRGWAAGEVAVVEPRQNGKGAILEARIVAGVFDFGEELVIYSAHNFDTSLEMFRRVESLILDTPELAREVKGKPKHSHGEEGFEFRSGQRIRFRTRTKGGGRGFSCDCLILDEAMFLPEFAYGALLPTLSARANPQVWYAGSAVDQEIHEHGVVLSRIRERGRSGAQSRLAFFEWALDFEAPADVPDNVMSDLATVAGANPAMFSRISADQVLLEQRSLDPRTFAVERCGVGDWARTDGVEATPFTYQEWVALRDEESELLDPICLAFDVSPDRMSSIAAAGRRVDGKLHVEVLEHRAGTRWLAARLIELYENHDVDSLVCDGFGPAGSVIAQVEDAGVPVTRLAAKEHTQACGQLVDLVKEQGLRHLGSHELAAAVRGARTRPLGDAWAWSRKASSVDISPLVAATLGLGQAALLPDDATTITIY
jgi:hypothetical protein